MIVMHRHTGKLTDDIVPISGICQNSCIKLTFMCNKTVLQNSNAVVLSSAIKYKYREFKKIAIIVRSLSAYISQLM